MKRSFAKVSKFKYKARYKPETLLDYWNNYVGHSSGLLQYFFATLLIMFECPI